MPELSVIFSDSSMPMNLTDLSDEKLFLKIREGNAAAFDMLFNRYWEKLYRIAYARLKDTDDAQDVVQEVLVRFWNNREKTEIKTSLEMYLMGAVRLQVIDHFRSRKVRERQLQEALDRINLLESSIHDVADYLELEQTLEAIVNEMPAMLKSIYLMRSENMSVKEIASKLGLADQTVKNYISEVLRRLRIALQEKYPEKHLTYLALLITLLNK
ncbi:sigma-70 family RNA polymerase sigma factor [Chryseolinea soli]|uniref:Sigma-70 family RNA polymerase sigma factor n=2 Tax=Chryseolinea soli TaxID=2321403 RepID=A0A385SSA4_9BACT|nr:sigma-70 family RNA polymerase sigma factor [Chryseolinea soli]